MAYNTANVKTSIEVYFDEQLSGSSSIDIAGTEFDTSAVTEWFEPRILGFSSVPSRKNDRTEFWTFSVNCFAKTPTETTHRVWELVDLVLVQFAQKDLAVLNYDGDALTTLFYIRFDEGDVNVVPNEVRTPAGSRDAGKQVNAELRLQQVNVTFTAALIT